MIGHLKRWPASVIIGGYPAGVPSPAFLLTTRVRSSTVSTSGPPKLIISLFLLHVKHFVLSHKLFKVFCSNTIESHYRVFVIRVIHIGD